ncbi:hypothetical protein J6590_039443 [Homalodisca vitripennis]|nr:hypothetical protein J6590_039443 [Homalodisca vitripennis]
MKRIDVQQSIVGGDPPQKLVVYHYQSSPSASSVSLRLNHKKYLLHRDSNPGLLTFHDEYSTTVPQTHLTVGVKIYTNSEGGCKISPGGINSCYLCRDEVAFLPRSSLHYSQT